MQRGFAAIILILALSGLVLIGFGTYYFKNNLKSINSFEDCAKAGYPVMESYPAQCNTPDGKHFVQQLSEEEKNNLTPPSPKTTNQETKDKGIYTNKSENYQISYPESLKMDTSVEGDLKVDSWIEQNEGPYEISVYSYKKEVNPRVDFTAQLQTEEEVLIDGKKTKKLTGLELNSNQGTLIHTGPLEHQGKYYLITYTSGNKLATIESLVIYETMLKSFKFLK